MEDGLLIKLKQSDEGAFKELYNLYSYKIYSFVLKYTRQQADTEDVVQNVFIHVWKYRKNFDTETVMDAVMFKTAKQEISKWYEKQKNIILEDTIVSGTKTEEEEPYSENEAYDATLQLIDTLLEKIPARRRKIFKLHKIEQKSYKEIAVEMDMTPSAVANQISKTLQFLRKGLEEYEFSFSIIMLLDWFLL